MTLALALWGAGTGTVATVGGVVALIRDRPSLVVKQRFELTPPRVREDGAVVHRQLVLHVFNNGRQPVALEQAGFALQLSTEGQWPRRRKRATVEYAEIEGPSRPLSLAPGAPAEFRLSLEGIEAAVENIPRGFAQTSRGSISLAEPPFGTAILKHFDPAK